MYVCGCVRVLLNVCYCVCSVCVTLFFIPGSDSIRIPYGTKLSLYMSKDAEGTLGFSHNLSSSIKTLITLPY